MISNNSQNNTFKVIPLCVKKNKVLKMDYIEWSAGSNPDAKQIAQVSYGTWTRTK